MRATACRIAGALKPRALNLPASPRRVCAARERSSSARSRAMMRSDRERRSSRVSESRGDPTASEARAKVSEWRMKKEPSERWMRTASPPAPLSSTDRTESDWPGCDSSPDSESARGRESGAAGGSPSFTTRIPAADYLLENWKRLRAPACPYFFLSTIRESRVRKPFARRAMWLEES